MVSLVVVERDEIRQNAHYNHGRDPDDGIAEEEERRKARSAVVHHDEGMLGPVWKRGVGKVIMVQRGWNN